MMFTSSVTVPAAFCCTKFLDEAVRRNPGCQVIFASPLADAPQVLLDAARIGARTCTGDTKPIRRLALSALRGRPCGCADPMRPALHARATKRSEGTWLRWAYQCGR